jgi:prepilin-type N-terminal cleavage/methylation domain-containing protein
MERFRRRFAPLRTNEGGFTLAELIISISILGIISGVLAAAFVVSGRTTAQTTERFNESHDAQIASAYLATDVQGAQAISAVSCFAAEGLTSLVNFSATRPPAEPPYPVTSWFSGTATEAGGDQVIRRTCTGPDEAHLTSDAPVIYHPVVSGPDAPVVRCDGLACDPAVVPTVVTITIHDRNRVDETDDFVYSLTGSRRAQLGETGSAPAAYASLMALGTTGTSSISGENVSVTGTPVVNSNQTESPAADPFAGLPQCPAALGCPSAGGPLVDVPGGTPPPGPGVYHDITVNTAVTFPPGIYVITGLLHVQAGADGASLAGVTLYFACTNYPAPCDRNSQGGSFDFGQDPGNVALTPITVTLTPVTTGEYAATTQSKGISIFVDRNNVASSHIDVDGRPTPVFASGTTNVAGAVYAAGARITITGGGNFVGGIVAKAFDIAGGNDTIAIGG